MEIKVETRKELEEICNEMYDKVIHEDELKKVGIDKEIFKTALVGFIVFRLEELSSAHKGEFEISGKVVCDLIKNHAKLILVLTKAGLFKPSKSMAL